MNTNKFHIHILYFWSSLYFLSQWYKIPCHRDIIFSVPGKEIFLAQSWKVKNFVLTFSVFGHLHLLLGYSLFQLDNFLLQLFNFWSDSIHQVRFDQIHSLFDPIINGTLVNPRGTFGIGNIFESLNQFITTWGFKC